MRLFIFLCLISPLTFAHSLLDYTVYTRGDIFAECSDYLGKVSADGKIQLRNFLIRQDTDRSGCALSAGVSVNFYSGSVENSQGSLDCIAAPLIQTSHVAFREGFRAASHPSLEAKLAAFIKRISSPGVARIINLSTQNYRGHGTITIAGESDELLMLQSEELHPVIEGLGIKLIGGAKPENIIWYFPRAQTLRIAWSGVDTQEYGEHVGMPGTFVAPQARVSFQNALITGALFAHSIHSPADRDDCQGLVAGQVNPAPLRLPKKD